jgi:O-antigen ligase
MNKNIELLLFGFAALAVFLWAGLSVLRGGFFNYASALGVLSPFLFLIVLRLRSHWHVILFISIVAGRVRLPMYGFQQLTILLVMSLFILATFVLDAAIQKRSSSFRERWPDRFVAIIALFLSLRLLYDRPGLVGFGASEGGFVASFTMVLGAWMYFAVRKLAARAKFTRSQLRSSVPVVIILLIVAMLHVQLLGGSLFSRALGEPETWMLAAIVLGLVATSRANMPHMIIFHACSLMFVTMGVMSGFRARFAYILAEVFAIAFVNRNLKKTLWVWALIVLAGGIVLFVNIDRIPVAALRFASLFHDVQGDERLVGGMGVRDTFRGQLYTMAWEEIRRSPLVGNGFGLNVDRALAILSVAGDDTFMQFLALGRSYHNSLLVVAAIAGIPITLMFIALMISIIWRFAEMILKLEDSDFRTWGMVVLAFMFAVLAIMLLNGGPREFYFMLILLGFMSGMMRNPQRLPAEHSPNGTPKHLPPSHVPQTPGRERFRSPHIASRLP